MFEFKILSRDTKSKARRGEFITPHGTLQTPALAIVGTEGQIKGISPEETTKLPLNYTIVNTFHIFVKGIVEKIHQVDSNSFPTVHQYGGFPNVVASDSGGFQVFSLGFGKEHGIGKVGILKAEDKESKNDTGNPLIISEDGVTFQWNGEKITLNPEKSMQIQHQIGADIIFAFDECTSLLNSYEYTAQSLELTHRWLDRCVAEHKKLTTEKNKNMTIHPQALFAIVQGGRFEDLRIKAAKHLATVDVPGFGIGGSFGEGEMYRMLEVTLPHLPDEKPRHLLGIGKIENIFEAVERGVDLFDCVIPTREARHKILYTNRGKIALKKIKTSKDPIQLGCKCIACTQKITGEQLYEFFLKKDPRAFFYATVHNIQFFSDLMEQIREAISHNTLSTLKAEFYRFYSQSS